MRPIALAALLAPLASEAAALSCMQPDFGMAFANWRDAEQRYYLARGTLTPLGPVPEVPDVMAVQEGMMGGAGMPDLAAPFRFEGVLIGEDGLYPRTEEVTVRVGCAGPWCGGFPGPREATMALAIGEDGALSMEVGPCPGTMFEGVSAEAAQACLRDGACRLE